MLKCNIWTECSLAVELQGLLSGAQTAPTKLQPGEEREELQPCWENILQSACQAQFVNTKSVCEVCVCVAGANQVHLEMCGLLARPWVCDWLTALRDSPGTQQPPAGTSVVPLGWNTEAKLEGAPRNWKLQPHSEWWTYIPGAWKAEPGALANLKPGLAGRAGTGRRISRAGAVQWQGRRVRGDFFAGLQGELMKRRKRGLLYWQIVPGQRERF